VTENQVIWSATDNCDDEVDFEIYGCYSDQDANFTDIVYGSDDPNDNVEPGFNSDCFYTPDNGGTIRIHRRVLLDAPEGRLFTILARAKDECNNTDEVTKEYLLPLTTESFTLRQWDGSTDCFPADAEVFCTAACPCEYNDPVCEDVQGSWSLSLSGNSHNAVEGHHHV